MKTSDFNFKLSSSQLKENISKQFGVNVNLEKYNREQLEDIRNKLRTRIFQHEGSAGVNDLLTNETYQKDKAMLELLNTRIKEMLGEDIKKLKDKMIELSEGKKGVKVAKHPRGSKGSGDGNLANNYPPYDKVTRGDVIAGATGKDQKGGKKAEESMAEGMPMVKGPDGKMVPKFAADGKGKKDLKKEGFADMEKAVSDRAKQDQEKQGTGKFDKKETSTGTKYTRKTSTFTDGGDEKAKADQRQKRKDDRAARKATGESAEKKCNHTPKGKSCPVHGLKECGSMQEAKGAKEPFAVGMAAAKKEAGITKTPAKDLPKKVVKKGHEIGKSIKKSQKNESTLIFRRNVKLVNESLQYLINEDEEEKAQAITSAGDMANDFTSWMQRVGQYQTKVMIELSDEIRHNFGPAEAEAFKQAVSPALAATLETLTTQREAISNAIAQLAGGQVPTPMGAEPPASPEPEMTPEPELAGPDTMNEPSDEFAASDAAAGTGTPGRELRESSFHRRLAESHSIISKLAK